jgi:nicotinamidase-related amidase
MAKTVRSGRKRSSFKKRRALIGKKSKVVKRSGSRRRMKLMRGGEVGKNVLLIIDPQQDFVDNNSNGHKASLGVGGASGDLDRLCGFLTGNPNAFSEIHVSLDSHTKTHIGHVGFWTPENASSTTVSIPQYFETLHVDTIMESESDPYKKFPILVGDPIGNVKTPKQYAFAYKPELQEIAYTYIQKMHELKKGANGSTKPTPCIWPEHCIIEPVSEGWKLYEPLKIKLEELKNSGIKVFYHEKGTNDFVEMYSIFSAEVPFETLGVNDKLPEEYKKYISATLPDASETSNSANVNQNYKTNFNEKLFEKLMGEKGENKVFVCGEAKSHCVKTSLEDMVENCKDQYQTKNIFVFEDMTSTITTPDFTEVTNAAYNTLKEKGVNLIKSSEISDFNEYLRIIRGNI